MTLKEAVKRIEELERKVKVLEAKPPQVIHYHYPIPQIYPSTPPSYPTYIQTPVCAR